MSTSDFPPFEFVAPFITELPDDRNRTMLLIYRTCLVVSCMKSDSESVGQSQKELTEYSVQ